MPLWPPELYGERRIELVLGSRVSSIDPGGRVGDCSRTARAAIRRAAASPPAPIRCGCRFPAPTARRCSICDRSPTAARSWNGCAGRSVSWSSARASSVSKSSAALRARGVGRGRRGARSRAARARHGHRDWAASFRPCTRRTASSFTSARRSTSIDGRTVSLEQRAAASMADFVVMGVGVRPATATRRAGRPGGRSRHRRQRISRNERARNLRGRRRGAVARSAYRRAHPRRALGRRRAPGPGRGAQHARAPRALRRRAVFLESALRRDHQVCRSRRALGRNTR